MNRLPRQLLFLIACFAAVVAIATPASAADDSPIGEEEDDCVYIPEDWNGYEFTYYCNPAKDPKNELQHYFNAHGPYYVNWTQTSENAIGYWRLVDGKPQECGPGVDRSLCHEAGQPCDRGTDQRADCLNDHNYTGIGEWMRGQDDPGILSPTEPHLLENIRDNPCDVLQAPPRHKGDDEYRLRDDCPDIRTRANPCDKVTDKDQREKCNEGHPWFTWKPPSRAGDAEETGCKYSTEERSGRCADTQLIGSDRVQAPRGVIEPLAAIGGYAVVVVFIAGVAGILGHLWRGVEAYRSGDAVAEVFGRTLWTLSACAGATSVSAVLWAVFNA